MCEYDSKLTDLKQDLNTQNVINMSSMLSSCKALTEVDISNFDTSSIGGADETGETCDYDATSVFYNCSALKTIYVSNKFDFSKANNSNSMFYNCTSLKNFDSTKTDNTNANTSSTGYLTLKE